jgi:hypothetical protein
VSYHFQTGRTEIKLLTEYENVTQIPLNNIGGGGYEQFSKQSFMVYLTSEIFVGFEKTLPGFDQHPPAKFLIFPLLLFSDRCPSLEIALTSFG